MDSTANSIGVFHPLIPPIDGLGVGIAFYQSGAFIVGTLNRPAETVTRPADSGTGATERTRV
jgi:hypothetical protein